MPSARIDAASRIEPWSMRNSRIEKAAGCPFGVPDQSV